jgi:hypothetical protein
MPRRGPEAGKPRKYNFQRICLNNGIASELMNVRQCGDVPYHQYSFHDERRRPRRGSPAADQILRTSKTSHPAMPQRGPEAGEHRTR